MILCIFGGPVKVNGLSPSLLLGMIKSPETYTVSTED